VTETGQWNYCSDMPYATHLLCGPTIEGHLGERQVVRDGRYGALLFAPQFCSRLWISAGLKWHDACSLA
jgi:hypothetical protein